MGAVEQYDGSGEVDALVAQGIQCALRREPERGDDADALDALVRRHPDRAVPHPAGDLRLQLLALVLREQLRVLETLRGRAGAEVDDAQPHGDGTGDRAAAHLVHADHEPRTLAQQGALMAERGDGRGHPVGVSLGSGSVSSWGVPAPSSTPAKTIG